MIRENWMSLVEKEPKILEKIMIPFLNKGPYRPNYLIL